jgi:hypothetical protein
VLPFSPFCCLIDLILLKEFETAVDEVYDRLDDSRLVTTEVRPLTPYFPAAPASPEKINAILIRPMAGITREPESFEGHQFSH